MQKSQEKSQYYHTATLLTDFKHCCNGLINPDKRIVFAEKCISCHKIETRHMIIASFKLILWHKLSLVWNKHLHQHQKKLLVLKQLRCVRIRLTQLSKWPCTKKAFLSCVCTYSMYVLSYLAFNRAVPASFTAQVLSARAASRSFHWADFSCGGTWIYSINHCNHTNAKQICCLFKVSQHRTC